MYEDYIKLLHGEMIPALGCTEPIAVAYVSAKAREALGEFPVRMELYVSGNVVKNVKGVSVPNSGGRKGLDVAGVLGVISNAADRKLQVLESIRPGDVERADELIRTGFIRCILEEGVENLYVRAVVYSADHTAEATLEGKHDRITSVLRDGEPLFQQGVDGSVEKTIDKSFLTIRGILDFADNVPAESVQKLLDDQIKMNSCIAQEGLDNNYGSRVGKMLLQTQGNYVSVRAKACAAAASDARMGGCALPVVINSGSGNQGITVSLPVLEYARELCLSREKTYRALLVSNLISIHIKRYIGSLSAFCGAVSAACASGAAITYMHGGTYEQICNTIVNTLGNTSGMVCDGAKASCAAKIAVAVESAILAHNMSMNGLVYPADAGIIKEDIEKTIQSIGHLGRTGMKETDVTILNIMLDNVQFPGA